MVHWLVALSAAYASFRTISRLFHHNQTSLWKIILHDGFASLRPKLGCLLQTWDIENKYIFLMNSDWRALLPYVDEGGIIAHTEQKTKVGSKQTQRERLNPGVERGVSEEHGAVVLGYGSAQTEGRAPSSRSGICPLKNTHTSKEISAPV